MSKTRTARPMSDFERQDISTTWTAEPTIQEAKRWTQPNDSGGVESAVGFQKRRTGAENRTIFQGSFGAVKFAKIIQGSID